MMKIYVATSWRNEFQPLVCAELREAGHEVYDFRHPAPGNNGFSWSSVDPEWQSWTPSRYLEGLNSPIAERGFKLDMDALSAADVCIMVMPCGMSASLETGYAVGAGKPTAVYVPGMREPDLMVKMADLVTDDLTALLNWARDKGARLRASSAPSADDRVNLHEYALIAQAVGERGMTDCSTPLYVRVQNLVERWDSPAAPSADAGLRSALAELATKLREEADEAKDDGDFCCALTRRYDADALDALLAEHPPSASALPDQVEQQIERIAEQAVSGSYPQGQIEYSIRELVSALSRHEPVYYAEALELVADTLLGTNGVEALKPEELDARAPKLAAIIRNAAHELRALSRQEPAGDDWPTDEPTDDDIRKPNEIDWCEPAGGTEGAVVSQWQLVEKKREWIPDWLFSILCMVTPRRRWMLRQPFRRMLFEKVADPDIGEPRS